MFRDSYFLTVEDVEWSYRARTAGWRVVYVPAAAILHKESMSTKDQTKSGKFSPLRVYYEHRNTLWFVREYANPVQGYLLWPAYVLWHYAYQAAGYIVLRRWGKLKALAQALRDGLGTMPSAGQTS